MSLLDRRSFLALSAATAVVLSLPVAREALAVVVPATVSVSVPPSTISVIDPLTGLSAGDGTTDVRVGPGDVIQFRVRYIPLPDAATSLHALQGYLTVYIPNNTEVVGLRLVDAQGGTVPPHAPGLGSDGQPGGASGSIAQESGDTGLFYATDSRLVRAPLDTYLRGDNGLSINPARGAAVAPVLGYNPANLHAHNTWDRDQSLLLGAGGDPPAQHGSPVAGSGAAYPYEGTSGTTTGPWARILYPGSLQGVSATPTNAAPVRLTIPAPDGFDLKPSGALVGARAVRFALGELRAGEPGEAEVTLRVLDTPLDAGIGRQNADVLCAEVAGSDLTKDSPIGGGAGSIDNPWALIVPSAACVNLDLAFDLTASPTLSASGQSVSLSLDTRNLSRNAQGSVFAYFGYDAAGASIGNVTGAPLAVACPPALAGLSCRRWSYGALASGATRSETIGVTLSGAASVRTFRALFVSDLYPAGVAAQALVLARPAPLIGASLAPGAASVAPGGTATLSGTIANSGNAPAHLTQLGIFLPSGWTVKAPVTLAGQFLAACTGLNTPSATCAANTDTVPNGTTSVSFSAGVAVGAQTGLYPVSIDVWTTTGGWTGAAETFVPEAAVVPVGAARSTPPVIWNCVAQGPDANRVSGFSSETDGTTIKVLLAGGEHCTTTVSSGAWTCAAADFGAFYPGLEVRATATAAGKLPSPPSDACVVRAFAVPPWAPACADKQDNDTDSFIDFPADSGCYSANDAVESDAAASAVPKPRVLLALATSGSLNGDACAGAFTGGDGSSECPGNDVSPGVCGNANSGNGFADDSRLYQIETGLTDALARGDVEFALMRSQQQPVAFVCPTASTSSASGGWQGSGPSCGGGFDKGEMLVAFSDGSLGALFAYLDHGTNVPGGALPPPGFDFELRASGGRPLAGMLDEAASYLAAAKADDSIGTCRPYRVVLVADGADTCGGDAAGKALALASASVPVDVVGFAASPDDAGSLIGIAAAGNGKASFVDDSSGLADVLAQLVDESTLFELCNGIDDNCNGLVDEDFPALGGACGNGQLGQCARTGTYICSADHQGVACSVSTDPVSPGAEICNGLDDDCDGQIDEGGVCPPNGELCNGADDNGNGQIDEGFPVNAFCTDGQVGACQATGNYVCSPDHTGVTCNVTNPGSAATAEVCNGIDDDCDGLVDEDAIGDMVQLTGTVKIDRYEASRPDATAVDPGQVDDRACSRPGVQPWRLVSETKAAAACAAVGKRLCTESEWQLACAGVAGLAFPYGNVYAPAACNGRDFDPDCSGPNDDLAVATGASRGCPPGGASTCQSAAGVIDLSGNLAEWTATQASAGTFKVRGGSYDDPAQALGCQFDFRALDGADGRPDIGFRCCSDPPPPPNLVFRDGYESP